MPLWRRVIIFRTCYPHSGHPQQINTQEMFPLIWPGLFEEHHFYVFLTLSSVIVSLWTPLFLLGKRCSVHWMVFRCIYRGIYIYRERGISKRNQWLLSFHSQDFIKCLRERAHHNSRSSFKLMYNQDTAEMTKNLGFGLSLNDNNGYIFVFSVQKCRSIVLLHCEEPNLSCNSPLLNSPVFICRNKHGPGPQACISAECVLGLRSRGIQVEKSLESWQEFTGDRKG